MLLRIRDNGTPVLLCYGKDDPWVVPAWGQKAKRDLGDSCLYFEVSNGCRKTGAHHVPCGFLCLLAVYRVAKGTNR